MPPSLDPSEPPEPRPWIWFFGSGLAFVLIAVIAIYVVHAPLWLIRILVPTSVLFFDPAPLDLATEVAVFFLFFGGTFLLYGTAGWLLGHGVRAWRSW